MELEDLYDGKNLRYGIELYGYGHLGYLLEGNLGRRGRERSRERYGVKERRLLCTRYLMKCVMLVFSFII